jgi:hypothetical protein
MKLFVVLVALCLAQSLQVVGQTQERQYQINGKVQRNGTSFTNSGTVTNQNNGKVGNFNRQRTCTDRVCSGTNTYQSSQDQTYTKNYDLSCQNGTCTKNSTIGTPKGNNFSVNSSGNRNSITGTVTNQNNGNVSNFNRQRTCADRVCTGTATYQTPQNQTYTGNFEATCQSGTCTKNSKILTPQGKSLSVNSSVTGEGQGAYSGQVKVTKP